MHSRKGNSTNGTRILREPRRPAEHIERKPYMVADISLWPYDSFLQIPPIESARLLEQITHVEGPVHLGVATRRIAKAIGATATKKSMLAVKRAAAFANVRIRSDFLYPPNYQVNTIRDHSTAPDADRKLEFVPQEEIEEAIMDILRHSFKISEQDVIKHALPLLGFKKLTKKAAEIMHEALQSLINRGIVSSEDGILSIPDPDA